MTDEPIFPEWKIDTPLEEIIGECNWCWLQHVGKIWKTLVYFIANVASKIVDETVAIIRKKLFYKGDDEQG